MDTLQLGELPSSGPAPAHPGKIIIAFFLCLVIIFDYFLGGLSSFVWGEAGTKAEGINMTVGVGGGDYERCTHKF